MGSCLKATSGLPVGCAAQGLPAEVAEGMEARSNPAFEEAQRQTVSHRVGSQPLSFAGSLFRTQCGQVLKPVLSPIRHPST